jgi:hypothetical protein
MGSADPHRVITPKAGTSVVGVDRARCSSLMMLRSVMLIFPLPISAW